MFDRFTDRARKVMGLARQASQRWGHDYIAPEHMLLGILDEDRGGVAMDALRKLADPQDLRAAVERRMPPGSSTVTSGQIPFTEPAKTVLELALDTASCFKHDYIGTEHLLLGLLRLPATVAARALDEAGVTLQDAYEQVLRLLNEEPLAEELGLGVAQPPHDVFDRFSMRARKTMGVAWQEARRLQHPFIGPEHILLALSGELPPRPGLDPERIRREAEARLTPGDTPFSMSELPFTPAAVRVLGLTIETAQEPGHETLGLPHLLVGLLREHDSVAAQVLRDLGVTVADAERIVREG